jgi:hypothetical protein
MLAKIMFLSSTGLLGLTRNDGNAKNNDLLIKISDRRVYTYEND